MQLAHKIDQIFQQHVLPVAKQTLEFPEPRQGPFRFFQPRTVTRAIKVNLAPSRWLERAILQFNAMHNKGTTMTQDLQRELMQHLDYEAHLLPSFPGDDHAKCSDSIDSPQHDWMSWWADCTTQIKGLHKERKTLRKKFTEKQAAVARNKLQGLFATNRKKANQIRNGTAASWQITALKMLMGKSSPTRSSSRPPRTTTSRPKRAPTWAWRMGTTEHIQCHVTSQGKRQTLTASP